MSFTSLSICSILQFTDTVNFRDLKCVFSLSLPENSSVIVMWASYNSARQRPQASLDGLHYGTEIIALVRNHCQESSITGITFKSLR